MQLDYQVGKETTAIFEPDFEQIVALCGLNDLCVALETKKRKINGNYFKRRKIAKQSRELRRDVADHLRASNSPMYLMGEFELEAVQRGTEELLDSDERFERLAAPAAPGGDELRNQLYGIVKAEKYRMYAETIYLAISTREKPEGWQPVFMERENRSPAKL